MSQSAPPTAPNKPGRYNRSFGGLIGSMVVLVIAVIVFVAVRGAVRADPTIEIEDFDYLASVRAAQAADFPVAYPPELPEEWQATPGGFGRDEVPEFSLNFLTATDAYVGVKVVGAEAGTVLTRVLGEGYEADGQVEVDAADDVLTGTWQVYTEGEDTALTWVLDGAAVAPGDETSDEAGAETGDGSAGATPVSSYVVVVFGSLGTQGLVELADDLTLAPLE